MSTIHTHTLLSFNGKLLSSSFPSVFNKNTTTEHARPHSTHPFMEVWLSILLQMNAMDYFFPKVVVVVLNIPNVYTKLPTN